METKSRQSISDSLQNVMCQIIFLEDVVLLDMQLLRSLIHQPRTLPSSPHRLMSSQLESYYIQFLWDKVLFQERISKTFWKRIRIVRLHWTIRNWSNILRSKICLKRCSISIQPKESLPWRLFNMSSFKTSSRLKKPLWSILKSLSNLDKL